jgi:hypothetical protein
MSLVYDIQLLLRETEKLEFGVNECFFRLERPQAAAVVHQEACEAAVNIANTGMHSLLSSLRLGILVYSNLVRSCDLCAVGSDHAPLSAVLQYLERQGDSSLKAVFAKFAVDMHPIIEHSSPNDSSISDFKHNLEQCIRADGLQAALIELGVQLDRSKVDELMLIMDLDGNGCLDFEEFKRAVQQRPTELEQWASMLPLAGMLARSLPVDGGPGDKPLRDFSRLGDDEIETAVEVFSAGLKLLLISARASSRQMFQSTDKKASDAAKDLADGVSAVSKYKTFKMSTGSVGDYHDDLASRIGMVC